VTRYETDIQALAEFRYQLRRFIRFSEQSARESGLEPQQHQLLLAVIGSPDGRLTIGQLAERMQLLPHSTDELIRRAEENGLVERSRSTDDRRVVHVAATAAGRTAVRRLTDAHRAELRKWAPALVLTLSAIARDTDGRA
jgi:DNA-binding MarR family transcriptional regulator